MKLEINSIILGKYWLLKKLILETKVNTIAKPEEI